MKRSDIRNAYDSMTPTPDQKDKMLASIIAKTPQEHNRTGKYQAQSAKTSRLSWIPAVAALFAVIVAGSFVMGRAPQTENPVLVNPTSESPITENAELPTAYSTIIEACRTAIEEGWDENKCASNNISTRFASSRDYAYINAGYWILDIDGNGTQELIIGHEDYIWNLYTLKGDNTAVQLISDTNDGTVYHLHEGGHIVKELTTKEDAYHDCFTLEGTELVLETSVYGVGNDYKDLLTDRPISQNKAFELIYRHDRQALLLTYFFNVPDYLREGSEAMELYTQTLEKYKTAIAEKWDSGKCVEEDISILVANFVETSEMLGFTMLDLDHNDTEELIITDGNVILDMYALVNGEPRLVFHGWERNVYYLSDGNHIFNRGSNGAANTLYNFYYYDNGSLVLYHSVVFDATEDPGNPWFQSFNEDTLVGIREEEAREIIDSQTILSIPFTPFGDGGITATSEQSEWEQAKEAAFDIIRNGEEFGYGEYIAWLIPWRNQEFENPRPLYYYLHDANDDGIFDLVLGYEDEVTAVWSYLYHEKAKEDSLTLLDLTEEEWAELDASWPKWDIRRIENFLREE